jgi:uncharacterized repeat protein (TIGR03803 family)
LALSGNTLYGTTSRGGGGSAGTVFGVNADGTGFTNLHSFTPVSGSLSTNSDGKFPYAGVVLSGNTLYGTTRYAGSGAAGTVFRLNTDGTGFTNLHSFTPVSGSLSTNSDGAYPYGGLMLSGNALFGTTEGGGSGGSGTIFKINTNGTGFANLYTFSAAVYVNSLGASTNSDGAYSYAGLLLSGNTLYGTTQQGTSRGSGAVFALTLASAPTPIPLNIQLIGSTAVLSWSDLASAFSLQAAPAVTGIYTNVPRASSPFTNAIVDSQEYFRLQSN